MVSKEKILEIVNLCIGNSIITSEQYDEDLQMFGMDSLIFIRIIVALEEELECEVPDSKLILTEMNTINKIYDVLTNIDIVVNYIESP